MKTETARAITTERLARWSEEVLAPAVATPVVLIAVGHGRGTLGELHVVTAENATDDELVAFLLAAAGEVRARRYGRP